MDERTALPDEAVERAVEHADTRGPGGAQVDAVGSPGGAAVGAAASGGAGVDAEGSSGGGSDAVSSTGDGAVDEALTLLAALDAQPLRAHVAAFDAVHGALQDRLADAEG